MNRAVPAVVLSLTFMLSGIAVAGTVQGQPPPPGTLCSFTLSPPQLVQLNGADMVTATVTPEGCAGAFRPSRSVVCIQGPDAVTHCSQASDTATAQVYAPYRPGASFTSNGRGVGKLFNDASEPNWQLLGPITAVL